MPLTPFVYWAQTEGEITLRVDVQTVKDDDAKTGPAAEVCIEDEEVEVTAVGVGAQSGHYHFVLEFYMPVDANASTYQVKETGIQITLVKREKVEHSLCRVVLISFL